MRVLPDVVGVKPRDRARRLLGAVAVAGAVAVLAGCAKFDAALGQRQAVVTFSDSSTLAQRLAVRTACAKTPDVVPQPLPSNKLLPSAKPRIKKHNRRAPVATVLVSKQHNQRCWC